MGMYLPHTNYTSGRRGVMTAIEGLKPKKVWNHFDEIRKIPRCSKHEGKIREYILAFAKQNDLESKTDAAGNVVVSKSGTSNMKDKPTVVLQGHMDMVCEKESELDHDFSKDPIKIKRENDILTAEKTSLGADNGIGVAIALAILEDSKLEHGPIEALFTVDEETGLTGAFELEKNMLTGSKLINLDSEDFGIITVGCAGGGEITINLPLGKQSLDESLTTIAIQISGLKGGHSGIEIHKQRGNAIKILARLLWEASQEHAFHLSEINGGSKHNAIPREASAIIAVDKNDKDKFISHLKKEIENIKEELKSVDPDLTVETKEGNADKAFNQDVQFRLLNLLHGLPHGVQRMSDDIPDLVETSTNLAIIKTKEDTVSIVMSSRSSVDSALIALNNQIHAIANLADSEVEHGQPYPGWQPDLDSELLQTAKKTFEDMFGKKAEVEAIHAGLECGIIGEKFEGMDMISLGPTIKNPHTTEEIVKISTVEKIYDWTLKILTAV